MYIAVHCYTVCLLVLAFVSPATHTTTNNFKCRVCFPC